VLQYVPLELQQLHQYLELEFNPLLLCKRVSPILEGLESDDVLKEYVESLRETTLIRLIKEVGVIYSI
jgi:translation initiation factor 3 subunit A